MKDAFHRRRDIVCRLLDEIPGVSYVRPCGAFYVFVDVSSYYGRRLAADQSVGSSSDMAAYLLDQARVAVVPGSVFGDDRCLRLSFACAAEDLTVALKRIAKALRGES